MSEVWPFRHRFARRLWMKRRFVMSLQGRKWISIEAGQRAFPM
jgi:hypothetical protein